MGKEEDKRMREREERAKEERGEDVREGLAVVVEVELNMWKGGGGGGREEI